MEGKLLDGDAITNLENFRMVGYPNLMRFS